MLKLGGLKCERAMRPGDAGSPFVQVFSGIIGAHARHGPTKRRASQTVVPDILSTCEGTPACIDLVARFLYLLDQAVEMTQCRPHLIVGIDTDNCLCELSQEGSVYRAIRLIRQPKKGARMAGQLFHPILHDLTVLPPAINLPPVTCCWSIFAPKNSCNRMGGMLFQSLQQTL